MSSAAAVPQTVSRFFELSLLGLLTSGFLAVVASGHLDLPTTLLTGVGLALRALLVSGLVRFKIGDSLVTAVTLIFILFYPLDYVYVAREFLAATVHLVFFLAVVRILSARTERDFFFVKVIAFLEMLSAALLSTGISFFVFLTFFLVFGVATFASGEIRRASQRPGRVLRGSLRSFEGRLATLTGFTTLGILILTSGLFFLLPRTARAAFSHIAFQRYHLTGFSGEVTLGQTGEMRQDISPVMHIRIEGSGRPMNLKWRGAALETFDGKRWSSASTRAEPLMVSQGSLKLADVKQRWRTGRPISYEVTVQDLDSDALFFTGVPEFLHINVPLILRMRGDCYRSSSGTSSGLHYFGFSHVDDHDAAASYQTGLMPSRLRAEYLSLPQLDPAISELTRRITLHSATEERAAKDLEGYLRTHYSYSTELPQSAVSDPLSNFLFVRKKGYCEYFASALAVMLRQVGIPSRVVTGFQSGVYNSMTGWYVIRGADAHSWVEAYLADRGWVTLDATPGGGGDQLSISQQFSLVMDALETFWQDWVVGYNLDHQLTLASRIEQSKLFRGNWFQRFSDEVRRELAAARNSGDRYAIRAVGLIAASLLFYFGAPPLWGWITLRRHMRRFQKGRLYKTDAELLYLRMLKTLRKQGIEKPAWLTPLEFVAVLPASPHAKIVAEFTEDYNRLRFGDDPSAGPRVVGLLRELEGLGNVP